MKRHGPLNALLISYLLLSTLHAQFLRPLEPDSARIYGVRGGIVVGVHPALHDSCDRVGPRGLLRIGLDTPDGPQLINFIAVEPKVSGKVGLSELERGADGCAGKRFRLSNALGEIPKAFGAAVPGRVTKTPGGGRLSFVVHVERFANGASPLIEVTLDERFPMRVAFRTFSADGGAAMSRCTLSATMGNLARCRNLWLADGVIHAADHYRGYRGNGFIEHPGFGRERLHTRANGDVVVGITSDEFQPSEVHPFPNLAWRFPVAALTQYWLKPKGVRSPSLHCRVNGRRVYWRSKSPLPGGIAYENFELRETFRPGGEFSFGLSTSSPAKNFGFGSDAFPGIPLEREKLTAEEASAYRRLARKPRSLENGCFSKGLEGWQLDPGSSGIRVFQARGVTRVTTFGKERDGDRGRLFQCLVVPKDARVLRFHLHGGCDRRRLRAALWDGRRLHRWMTGRNDNIPFRVDWNIEGLRGRIVTLELVDRSTTRWGFIGAHGFSILRSSRRDQ